MTEYSKGQHLVPQFYLAGFTDSGEKGGTLYALDLKTGKQFPTSPNGIFKENDFYTIFQRDLAPDAFDKELIDIEGRTAEVFRKIATDKALPKRDTEDFLGLIAFVALMSQRVRTPRQLLNGFVNQFVKLQMEMIFNKAELWNQYKARLESEGFKIPPNVTPEQYKESMLNDMDFGLDNTSHIRYMLEGVKTLVPLLHDRKWQLLNAPIACDFITSDNPVSLVWTIEMSPLNPPGFGMSSTILHFPLSSRQALVGRFEGEDATLPATTNIVVTLNSIILSSSHRFVASARETFEWLSSYGTIMTQGDIKRIAKEKFEKARVGCGDR